MQVMAWGQSAYKARSYYPALTAPMWTIAQNIVIFWNTVFWLSFLHLLCLYNQKEIESYENIRWV